MSDGQEILPRMEVVDAENVHVGYVEAVDGDSIRLMRDDPNPAAPHHRVPVAWVVHVGQTVKLARSRDEVVRTCFG